MLELIVLLVLRIKHSIEVRFQSAVAWGVTRYARLLTDHVPVVRWVKSAVFFEIIYWIEGSGGERSCLGPDVLPHEHIVFLIRSLAFVNSCTDLQTVKSAMDRRRTE